MGIAIKSKDIARRFLFLPNTLFLFLHLCSYLPTRDAICPYHVSKRLMYVRAVLAPGNNHLFHYPFYPKTTSFIFQLYWAWAFVVVVAEAALLQTIYHITKQQQQYNYTTIYT